MRPDIRPGPKSANRPKAAVSEKRARMSASDPNRTLAEITVSPFHGPLEEPECAYIEGEEIASP
jgi:hypothetical protein